MDTTYAAPDFSAMPRAALERLAIHAWNMMVEADQIDDRDLDPAEILQIHASAVRSTVDAI